MASTTFVKQLPEHGSCFLCGSENPHNPGLRWYVDEKGVVTSEFTLTIAQQGPPGYAHGGSGLAGWVYCRGGKTRSKLPKTHSS
jgi:hypothetical protein